jgi:putative Holliday junction resolvase
MELLKDNSERILSIDFGTKRLGIAITDPLKLFAIPLTTIKNEASLWKELKDIFEEYNIVTVIIGYPLKEDGSKSNIIQLIDKFVVDFKNKFEISIKLVDERYSSAGRSRHRGRK